MKKLIVVLSTIGLIFSVVSCKKDPYVNSIYSEQPEIGVFQEYLATNESLPAEGIDPILASGTEIFATWFSGVCIP